MCLSFLSLNTSIFSLHLASANAFVKRKLFLASKKSKYNTILFEKISKFVMYEELIIMTYLYLALSITDIIFVIYFVIADRVSYRDKRLFMHTVFTVSELALGLWKKYMLVS